MSDFGPIQRRWRAFIAAHAPGARAEALFSAEPRAADERLLSRLPPLRISEYQRISSEPRAREWAEARRLELELRERLGARASLSIAHSQGVIAVGATGEEITGVGVDLEGAVRQLSEATLSRLLDSEEARLAKDAQASGLEIWTLKEAAFKATPDNTGTVLSSYLLKHLEQVNEAQTRYLQGNVQGPAGRTLPVEVHFWNGFIISFAVCVREHLVSTPG
ncbi:MAG: 4'-phosphopantetheinyl transferase superfamily protein [Oligoflexia bacterium]|nr:4'-phosphopantetheinyl transferase superfamily protein [Oligoflexia bacterium]